MKARLETEVGDLEDLPWPFFLFYLRMYNYVISSL
jgi:hypothetical protein